jgi:hypothetical protein
MKLLKQKVQHVIGPDGRPLGVSDLPPPETKRWVIRRKAEVVAAVRGGLLSFERACQLYNIDPEEFLTWQYCIDRYGFAALRATHAQFYVTHPKRVKRLRATIRDMIGEEANRANSTLAIVTGSTSLNSLPETLDPCH